MAKRDPNKVIDQFQGDIKSSLSDLAATRKLVGTSGALAQRAAMDAFTRLAVSFERFRSDWHIAAITQDAGRFRDTQRHRVKVALEETDRAALVPYLPPALTLPLHPTLEQVAGVLDAEGSNLSIPSVKDWQDLAKRHLEDPWKSKVAGLGTAQIRTFNAVVALRNAAAHQSPRASKALADALNKLTLPGHAGLRRATKGVTVQKLPTYLNGAGTNSQERRVDRYHALLRGLAEDLRTP